MKPFYFSIPLLLLQIPQPVQVGPSRPAPRLGPDPAVHFFVACDPQEKFAQITIGIKRVVMVAAGGDRIIFRADPAMPVDLTPLANGEVPRFEFLARNVVPNGVYDGLRVELDPHLTVTLPGTKAPIAAALTDTRRGIKDLFVEFPAPRRFDVTRNVGLAFDLAHWSLRGKEMSVETETDPDTQHVRQLGLVVRDRLPATEVARQVTVSLTGFVTGPIGRPPSPLVGMRQTGWILPVRFGARRPKRGDTVRVTGVLSASDDAFEAARTEWVKGQPPALPAPKPLPGKPPAKPAIKPADKTK